MLFEDQIKNWRLKFEKKTKLAIGNFLVDFTNHLVGRTPVGDPSLWNDPPEPGYKPGTLINSWYTTLAAPYVGGVRRQSTSGADSVRQARQVANVAMGKLIYITNPTPYANMIEYEGHSSQAPAGMTRITAVQFFNTRKLRRAFRDA